MINYNEMEKKWQAEWERAKIFESDINGRKSYMVTAAFPYANAPQHIGHLRTFGTADVLARYKRMKGLNVLYPMAFHATGTPILAFAKRLKNNDKDLINELHIFHVPDAEIQKMSDPLYMANYFINEIETGMKRVGYSIDWRRKFVSIEPFFSKFIEWQFGVLDEKGYLVKGKHPVGWCPNENNAVGMHDTKHDVEPEIDEELSIKFKVDGEDAYFLCTTYREETVFGATNIFINKDATYVLCKINGESSCYISKKAAKLLEYQFKIEPIKEITGVELLAKRCINPMTKETVPVLPGFFVKEDIGTGVVMSVPAHAPFDYAALQQLKASGYLAQEIKPIKVIEIKGAGSVKDQAGGEYIDMPALSYINLFSKGAQAANEMLEAATKLQYKEEARYGKMIAKGYEGMSEPDAREKIKAKLLKAKEAFQIYVLTNSPVYCRCGYQVVVRIEDNQWFLNYGDKEWKGKVRKAFEEINVLPEKSRNAFTSAIDWIDLRAVARAQGLGTRFPLDKNFIIESLSDSTIYMSFYTISNLIRDIDPNNLTPEFFDYVYLHKGDIDDVAKSTKISYDVIKKCRDSFDYWYTSTSRHSGPDLIFNHLTMYIFNHVAIFSKEYWPKQIAVNGSVLSEGEKMSKSLGNIVPLMDGVEKYGADLLRFVVAAGADLFSDSEFSADAAQGVNERLEYLFSTAANLNGLEAGEFRHIDYWLYSKLNRKIKDVTGAMEKLELRGVSTGALYDSIIELRRYFVRGGKNGLVVRDYLTSIVLMLAPIVPHAAEELWHMLGNATFVSIERWPVADESLISDKTEREEELIDSIINDSKQVMELLKKKANREAKEVTLIVAQDWKTMVNNRLAKEKNPKKVIAAINEGSIAENLDKEKAIKYVTQLARKMNSVMALQTDQESESKLLEEAKEYIRIALKCKVNIELEGKSKSKRADFAMPHRPAIDVAA